MITYKQQFDKLTEAYISGKVNPYDGCQCFVGNLLDNRNEWLYGRDSGIYGKVMYGAGYNTCKNFLKKINSSYSVEEIVELEGIFMNKISEGRCNSPEATWAFFSATEEGQQTLFEAFELTLAKLKEIHESKGEIIDNPPIFIKRKQLVYESK